MNPLPLWVPRHYNPLLSCSPKQIHAYQNRVSGPIRDRIDILLSLKPVLLKKSSFDTNEPSKVIQEG
jgi:magnesium chelatase family protein